MFNFIKKIIKPEFTQLEKDIFSHISSVLNENERNIFKQQLKNVIKINRINYKKIHKNCADIILKTKKKNQSMFDTELEELEWFSVSIEYENKEKFEVRGYIINKIFSFLEFKSNIPFSSEYKHKKYKIQINYIKPIIKSKEIFSEQRNKEYLLKLSLEEKQKLIESLRDTNIIKAKTKLELPFLPSLNTFFNIYEHIDVADGFILIDIEFLKHNNNREKKKIIGEYLEHYDLYAFLDQEEIYLNMNCEIKRYNDIYEVILLLYAERYNINYYQNE